MDELLIYNDDVVSGGVIHFGERPAAQNRDAGGMEVVGGYHDIACAEALVGGQFGLVLDAESDAIGTGGRQIGSSGDSLRARNVLEARNHVADEDRLRRGVLILRRIEREAGGEAMVWLASQMLMPDEINSED